MANNDEICEQILNKKFKKSVFSGYDTADVDTYFDQIIDYLKNADKMLELYKEDVNRAYDEIDKRDKIINDLEKENAKLKQAVQEYEEEGYGNMLLKRRNQKQ